VGHQEASPQAAVKRWAACKRTAGQPHPEAHRRSLLLIAAGVGILAAVILIMLSRPGEARSVDYSGIPFAQPVAVSVPKAETSAPPAVPASPHDTVGAVLGEPDAPVTMVIYADFQCPFCGQFFAEVHPRIVEDFVRPGKVKLEYREFPVLGGTDLTGDENESVQAAEAAMCAGEQDAYLAYHDTLFAHQSGENQGAFSNERLKEYAGDLGLDTVRFSTCLDEGRYEKAVIEARMGGDALGITGTPMFVINGRVTEYTVQQYELLEKQLDAAVIQAES